MVPETHLSSEDLLALANSARELSSEIDLDDVLKHILISAGRLTNSPAGSVILYDKDRDGLYFAAATGDKADKVLEQFGETGPERVPLHRSKAGTVYRTGESIVEHSMEKDPNHFKGVDRQTNATTESMVCVPLTIGGDRLGVVQLLNKRTGNYTNRDVLLLELFAAHAAVALRNARHFQDLLAHMGLYTAPQSGRKTQDLLSEIASPARQERMTILFGDMRGFTQLSQLLRSPHTIQQLLNEFLTMLSSQVMRYDGIVNKFLGDGVLALFRGSHTEARAVKCTFDVLDDFYALRDRWNRSHNEDLTFIDIGVGIVTDDVIIGSIGSTKIKDFTAMGNAVNLAAAFENAARGGMRVLVDQNTFVAVQGLIADFEGPAPFELKKSDQAIGHVYKRYHVKRLRSLEDSARPPSSVRLGAQIGSPLSALDLRPYYDTSWAIVVGIDTCRSPRIPKLSYAVADANAIAAVLPSLGFPSNRIDLLVNQQATSSEIRQAINEKFALMGPDDRLFVFLALHGHELESKGSREGFLLTFDAELDNLPRTALPIMDLTRSCARLPAKHILFAIDSCFSGYAVKRGNPPAAASLAVLTREPVVQVISAGTEGQDAIEDGGHGIFTKYLLKGLEGWADPDGSGLTAIRLAAFVQERVVQASQSRQIPQYGKLEGEGEFLFRPPRAS
jgi:class 3 adenylate cyclase/putative methionine-R-sulfoxide reductase with GAF domain